MANPIHDAGVAALCHELNTTETHYPGTNLRLNFVTLGSSLFPPGQDVRDSTLPLDFGWIVGVSLAGLTVVLGGVQWLVAKGATCPLCRTPALASMRCTKHRQARTLFGSHRLRVAMAILFRNQYRCPYCNESTQMVARESRMAHRRQPTR